MRGPKDIDSAADCGPTTTRIMRPSGLEHLPSLGLDLRSNAMRSFRKSKEDGSEEDPHEDSESGVSDAQGISKRSKPSIRRPTSNMRALKIATEDVAEMEINKTRRLYIIAGTIVLTIIVIYGLAAVIIELVIFGDLDFEDSSSDVEIDSGPWSVTDTAPTSNLNEAQFQVYVGFILWITLESAGVGLEYVVWHYLLQIWDKKREAMWIFAQFVFSLLVAATIGLALARDFLAMPFLVMGMWKFGFPETIMYLYLGLFDRQNSPLCRTSDFINGIGTVLHHSAAAFLVSMLLAGVIPSSRYVLNSCLILVVQHWFIMLKYVNEMAYATIELILEAWFEWTVLSDFYHIRSLHWTATLGTGIFLLAHWLYLIAGFLFLFADKTTKEEAIQRGTRAYRRHSVKQLVHEAPTHSRGGISCDLSSA